MGWCVTSLLLLCVQLGSFGGNHPCLELSLCSASKSRPLIWGSHHLYLPFHYLWDCSSNLLTTPSQEIGSFKRCHSLATLKSRHPKTHTNGDPHICLSSITHNHLNFRIELLHCQRFKPKKWLWTKVFVRFTTKIISVSSKKNPYGFKSYFLIFFTKALALFYEAKKKLWRSNLLRHCNHKKKNINWKMSLLYNLHINRWKNSNIIYLSTQKCLPWSQANSLWCLIWIVANFLSVMGIQWKLRKEKELKINATFRAGSLSKDIWCGRAQT